MQILIDPRGNNIVRYFTLFYYYIEQENSNTNHEILFQKHKYKYILNSFFFFSFFLKKKCRLLMFIQLLRVHIPERIRFFNSYTNDLH